jgi:hypothetical protein
MTSNQYTDADQVSLDCITLPGDLEARIQAEWDDWMLNGDAWDDRMLNGDESEAKYGILKGGIPGRIRFLLHPQNNRFSAFLVSGWRLLR